MPAPYTTFIHLDETLHYMVGQDRFGDLTIISSHEPFSLKDALSNGIALSEYGLVQRLVQSQPNYPGRTIHYYPMQENETHV